VVPIQEVQVIDYPHYFTPNGDGFHDTWNVSGLQNFDAITKIYIFDRFGKLLKQLSSSGEGWDGTYNGQLLPSTDYWFTVDYPENGVMKQFKAHFSLKR
jgi:gliding motility-associated-like protein